MIGNYGIIKSFEILYTLSSIYTNDFDDKLINVENC